MNHLLTLLVSLCGFASIGLSMHRHQENLLGDPLPASRTLMLRLSGWLLLIIAYGIAVRGFGWGIGSVAWIGHLGAAAGMVILSLVLYDRRTAR
jgi:membrane associated rhomboid family serine protease